MWQSFIDMGDMPVALFLFLPRIAFSYFVVALAMLGRACARLVSAASSYEMKANLRILIVTDYMPPQTHGIAIRFRQYIDYMRKEGHEVHVFCTNTVREKETSFDHPNLPSITNPYNVKNKMAYNAGVKLSWFLSAKQWDLVHVVCPSNICWAVLPVAAWRRIPIYVSHHVDMEYYVYEYVKAKAAATFGWSMYWLLTKFPCQLLAQVLAVDDPAPRPCPRSRPRPRLRPRPHPHPTTLSPRARLGIRPRAGERGADDPLPRSAHQGLEWHLGWQPGPHPIWRCRRALPSKVARTATRRARLVAL